MADVKGLLSDPEFKQLDLATQKSVLGRLDPDFAGLSDADFQTFTRKMQGQDQQRRPENIRFPLLGTPIAKQSRIEEYSGGPMMGLPINALTGTSTRDNSGAVSSSHQFDPDLTDIYKAAGMNPDGSIPQAQGSAGSRFLKGLASPITGPISDIYQWITNPREWYSQHAMPGTATQIPHVVGQLATGDIAGALGAGTSAGALAALGQSSSDPSALNARLRSLQPTEPVAPPQPSTFGPPELPGLARFVARRFPVGKVATDAYDLWRTSQPIQEPAFGPRTPNPVPSGRVPSGTVTPPEPPAFGPKAPNPAPAPPRGTITPVEPPAFGPKAPNPIKGTIPRAPKPVEEPGVPQVKPTPVKPIEETMNPEMATEAQRADMVRQLHAEGQRQALPGSPAGSRTGVHEYLKDYAIKKYGIKDWGQLEYPQMLEMMQQLRTTGRLK